jgi:hypothetical protein
MACDGEVIATPTPIFPLLIRLPNLLPTQAGSSVCHSGGEILGKVAARVGAVTAIQSSHHPIPTTTSRSQCSCSSTYDQTKSSRIVKQEHVLEGHQGADACVVEQAEETCTPRRRLATLAAKDTTQPRLGVCSETGWQCVRCRLLMVPSYTWPGCKTNVYTA